MDNRRFRQVLGEYRRLMRSAVPVARGMDWVSDVYVHGSRCCVEVMEEHLPDGAQVLDFGCGMGLISVLLSDLGYAVTGLDINIGEQSDSTREAMGDVWGSLSAELEHPRLLGDCWDALSDRYGIRFLAFDGSRIPLESGSFDGVVAHGVYEHVNRELLPGVIVEISRVLVRGGRFFIFRTPRKRAYLERLAPGLGLPTHQRFLDEADVEKQVSGHGLRLVQKGFTDMVPSFLPWGLETYNSLSGVMTGLDSLLLRTPLRKYAHHMALVFEKT